MGEITDFVELYVKDSSILPEAVDEISKTLEENIKEEAPYKQGRLKRSIRTDGRVYGNYGLITGTWDEGVAPHGIYVLAGTDEHDIYAKPGSALNTPYGPFKKVHHPGTAPDDFLGRGLERTVAMYR